MAQFLKLLRRGQCDESGAELVEFGLTLPLLLFVVLGIMDFGLTFQQYEVLTNAAREGARVSVLPNYTSSDVQTRVTDYVNASFLSQGGSVTTTVGAPQSYTVGTAPNQKCMTTIAVTVTYPHNYLFLAGIAKYFGKTFGTKTLKAQSTMRTEAMASSGACP
jgi:Flp pilus assembly protein TadG